MMLHHGLQVLAGIFDDNHWQGECPHFHLLLFNNLEQCNSARQATFDFGNKYSQMELSDVIKKISWVVNES